MYVCKDFLSSAIARAKSFARANIQGEKYEDKVEVTTFNYRTRSILFTTRPSYCTFKRGGEREGMLLLLEHCNPMLAMSFFNILTYTSVTRKILS